MLRNHTICTHNARSGLTLVEILVSLTLMLMIMLALVQVFQYVGRTINETQSAMLISGRVRGAALTIEKDLRAITAPATPPLRFENSQGYLCIIEGIGSHYGNPKKKEKPADTDKPINEWTAWESKDIAINSDNGEYDSTVGDIDDIIMFTARAPEGSMFRGLVAGKVEEAKEAEICLFVRGTTLYRRVLLIYPDDKLQKALNDGNYRANHDHDSSTLALTHSVEGGYGFFKDFDVSVHLGADGFVHANTLADLTRRENRFGHWNKDASGANSVVQFPYGVHNNAAWYQLRLPTMGDCIHYGDSSSGKWLWQAGKNIINNQLASKMVYADQVIAADADDNGPMRPATLLDVPCGLFPNSTLIARTYPTDNTRVARSYIDFWKNPLPWKDIDNKAGFDKNAGYITQAKIDSWGVYTDCPSAQMSQIKTETSLKNNSRVSEDVLLTNVIGFDVKIWDKESKSYIDLGSNHRDFERVANPNLWMRRDKFFRSMGNYCFGHGIASYGDLPAVYDTWTDAYENDPNPPVAGLRGIGVSGDYSNIYEHQDKWRYPPPYTIPLEGMQVKVRVMDPATPRGIREMTVQVNLPK